MGIFYRCIPCEGTTRAPSAASDRCYPGITIENSSVHAFYDTCVTLQIALHTANTENSLLVGDSNLRILGGIERLREMEPDERRGPQKELCAERFGHHSKTNSVRGGNVVERLIEERDWKDMNARTM